MRELSAANTAQIDAVDAEETIFFRIDSTEPVYAHSNIGDLPFNGLTYKGVGDLGNIGDVREADVVDVSSINAVLSGVNDVLIAKGLDAGEYGANVEIDVGYVQDDGTLADTPWPLWGGWYETSTIVCGDENRVVVTCQSEFADFDEIPGRRFSDEDQQAEYPGDRFFEFAHEITNKKLIWGGQRVAGGGRPKGPGEDFRR